VNSDKRPTQLSVEFPVHLLLSRLTGYCGLQLGWFCPSVTKLVCMSYVLSSHTSSAGNELLRDVKQSCAQERALATST